MHSDRPVASMATAAVFSWHMRMSPCNYQHREEELRKCASAPAGQAQGVLSRNGDMNPHAWELGSLCGTGCTWWRGAHRKAPVSFCGIRMGGRAAVSRTASPSTHGAFGALGHSQRGVESTAVCFMSTLVGFKSSAGAARGRSKLLSEGGAMA